MTPAEKVAKSKRRKRPKRNAPPKPQPQVWEPKLREIREELDLSLRDVADSCELSVAAYFRIEHGYADPCLSTARTIAAFFGRDVWELWPKRHKGA